MQSVAEAQWWRVRAKATPLEQKTTDSHFKVLPAKKNKNDYSRNCTFALTSELRIVRDLEGGPNCRVSECQGFITKQRYKRVVIFACDLTTRTE